MSRTLEWIRHAYEVAGLLDTEEKVGDMVSAMAEGTGEDGSEVRREVLSIIEDVCPGRFSGGFRIRAGVKK